MSTAFQISIHFSVLNTISDDPTKRKSFFGLKSQQPINGFSPPRIKLKALGGRCSLWRESIEKDGFLMGKEKNQKRVVLVRVNRGFGFGGGGGGGGGRDNSNTARVLGNLALAIGLTYLSMTGQLGWVLDAIVSIWLLAVLLPIAGLGAFLWFAGRDIVQGSCPNCGNDFQIFKSSLKDGVQFCPFCTQPFSVQDDKFVRESAKFSSEPSPTFGQAFNGFSRRTEKGKSSSVTVVDIEAEVKDID
ncbi:uncharacterized protein LOC131221925 [Magnolia sinica]|uniref:uncharacterized protein LOC131221925 n=1 Tax=Magnolia sinica TaxID=86752 RepID=UPI00265B54E2|nr:uncharacterized protein LOC131221925 [Magnolia sinica]